MSTSKPTLSIVILVNTLFYPARRNGMTVRYFPLLRGLAERGHVVDVIIINKYHEHYAQQDIQGLKGYCRNVDVIDPPPPRESALRRLLRRLRNVAHLLAPFGRPYEQVDNHRGFYLRKVGECLTLRNRYDAGLGVGVGGNNADMLLALPEAIRPPRILCDFIDSAYLLRRRARTRVRRFLGWAGLLEEWKTRRWERAICRRCPCIYISSRDAESICSLANVIPNSIVEDGYASAAPVDLDHPNIAFLGNMAYPPNAEAGTWLARELFPPLRQVLPGLQCYIIGRNPSKELLQLCRAQGIHVTGEVDNVWDYIRSVDVFVFPLFSGAGLQNKVLEAMYAGRPVVCTPIANDGIGAVHGAQLYLASSRAEFLAAIRTALGQGGRTGRLGSAFVREHFSTGSVVERFERLLRG